MQLMDNVLYVDNYVLYVDNVERCRYENIFTRWLL